MRPAAILVGVAVGAAVAGPQTTAAQTACMVAAHQSLETHSLRLGEDVAVRLRATSACPDSMPRQVALVLGGMPDAALAEAVGAAAGGFVDAYPFDTTELALVLGHREQGGTLPPSRDAAVLKALLAGYGPDVGGLTLAEMIGAGRPLLAEAGDPRRKHVFLVVHSATPPGSPLRLDLDLASLSDQAIDATRFCVGGGCPPLPGVETLDVTPEALEGAMGSTAARPAPRGLHWLRIRQRLGATVDYVWGSATTPPTRMLREQSGDALEWTIPDAPEEVVITLHLRPFGVGATSVLDLLTVDGLDPAGRRPSASTRSAAPVHMDPAAVLPSACQVRAEAAASPDRLTLFDSLTGGLSLLAECPEARRPADVVLAFDQSSSMQGLNPQAIQRAAAAFLDAMGLVESRAAILMYGTHVDLRTGLTRDRASLDAALAHLEFEGDTHLEEAVHAARGVLDARAPGALPAVVVLTDGVVTDNPVPAADWARIAGIRMAMVCFVPGRSCDARIASMASSQYFALAASEAELVSVYRNLGEYLARTEVERLSVTLDEGLALVHDSTAPAGPHPPVVAGNRLAWHRAEPLFGRTELSVPLVAVGIGTWPLAQALEAIWLDTTGAAGGVSVPLPEVIVSAPEAEGPCTAAAPNRSVQPDSIDLGGELSLTTRLDVSCARPEAGLDVVFAVDHSFSMGQLGRLDNARRAVEGFMSTVADEDAHFGLVAFSDSVSVSVPPSADTEPVRQALAGLRPTGGTDIGRAIDAGVALLREGRPGALLALVLLTDGDNSPTGAPILDAAGRAREAGVTLAAVCAGGRCAPVLADAATAPQFYFEIGDDEDMVALFQSLGRTLADRSPAVMWLSESLHRGLGFSGADRLPEPPSIPGASLLWELVSDEDGPPSVELRLDGRLGHFGPATLWGRLDYATAAGRSGAMYLPAPVVQVRTEAVSPWPTAAVPPTSTPEPTAGPYPSPTPGPLSEKLYLPAASQG